MEGKDFNPWRAPRFELDDRPVLTVGLELDCDMRGTVSFHINDDIVIGGIAIPRKILFVGDEPPALTLGIEVRDGGVPRCVYLELAAQSEGNAVQPKHLKALRIEEWVTELVATCANHRVTVPKERKLEIHSPDVTRDDYRAVERMQRRRRDPKTDRVLLERVADLYRQHPDAPNKAVASDFGVSERTAARWADYCSEAGLLPKAPKQGQKRL